MKKEHLVNTALGLVFILVFFLLLSNDTTSKLYLSIVIILIAVPSCFFRFKMNFNADNKKSISYANLILLSLIIFITITLINS